MAQKLIAALLFCLLPATVASARPVCNDRMCADVAWGGMAADVVKAIAQKRALMRKSHPRRYQRTRLTIKRIHGPAPRRVGPLEHVAGRPASCPPRAWCGCWLAHHLGMPARSLWLAANWRFVGRPAGPAVGTIVVWRHHVGIITGRTARGWVVKSGNDGHAVRERVRSVSGAIAYRVAS